MLQEDSRRTYADLGNDIGVSAPSVHARVKKLERRGTIRRYTIDFVAVQQQPGFQWERLERALPLMPAIEACYSVTGEDTSVLKVRVANPAMLEDLLRNIVCLEGVAGVRRGRRMPHGARPPARLAIFIRDLVCASISPLLHSISKMTSISR